MSVTRAFWRWSGALVLGNFLLLGLVLWRGDRAGVEPVSVSPTDGAVNVSARPDIRIRYRRPVDAASLQAAWQIEPAVEGSLETSADTLVFRPAQALQPDTTYTISLAAGVRESGGRTSLAPRRIQFHTRRSQLVVLRPSGGVRNLWLVDPFGGTERALTHGMGDIAVAEPSPSGDRIAFVVAESSARWSLWQVSTAGGEAQAIRKNEPGVVSALAWAPDGDLLAYEQTDVYSGKVSAPRLWLTRTDGAPATLLYGRGQEAGSAPVWAPAGRQLAFYDNQHQALSVFNFTRSFVTIPVEASASVSWSPDGQQFVYPNRPEDNRAQTVLELARPHVGGQAGQPITAGGLSDTRPAWSPRGDWIAFVRLAVDTQAGIWVVSPSGGTAQPLHQERGWIYGPPGWAPDGDTVAFSRTRAIAGAPVQEAETWIAPLQGAPRRAGTGQVVAWIP